MLYKVAYALLIITTRAIASNCTLLCCYFSLCSIADKYAVRFIPRENGLYLIDVKFNGSHIPGSPFKIRVGETGQAGDPGMVSAYGAGLEGGTTGTCISIIFCVELIFSGLLELK